MAALISPRRVSVRLLTLLAIVGVATLVAVTGSYLALRAEASRTVAGHAQEMHRFAKVAAPLLASALIVGDLETARQTMEAMNPDLAFSQARLRDSTGRLLVDASRIPRGSDAPRWFVELLGVSVPPLVAPIEAGGRRYGLLELELSTNRTEEKSWREAKYGWGILAALLLAIGVIAWFGFHLAMRPIVNLANVAERRGWGEHALRVPPSRLAEVAPTVDAFNDMADRGNRLLADLALREMELRDSKSRLDETLAVSSAFTWEVNFATRHMKLGVGWAALLGLTPGETLTTMDEWAGLVHPEDRARADSMAAAMAAGQREDCVMEIRVRSASGEWIWVHTRGRVTELADGAAIAARGIGIDATARKRAEAAFAESDTRFRDIARASGDWFWENDVEGRLTWVSDSVERITGTPAQWFIGKRPQDLVVATDGAGGEEWQARQRARERREPYRDFHYLLRLPRGEFWISSSGVPRFSADGAFLGYRGTTTDITAQKRAEQALTESEAKFRALTGLSADWYWEQDANFRFVALSEGVAESGGIAIALHIGKTRWELPCMGVSKEQWAAHRAALERHEPFRDFEFQRISERGDMIWLETSGDPVFDADGRFIGYRGVGRNIAQRKRLEEELEAQNRELEHRVAERTAALAASEARLRAVVDGAPTGIANVAPDGKILDANQRFCQLFGYARDEVIGRFVRDFAHPEDWPANAALVAEMVNGRRDRFALEMRYLRKDGAVVWANLYSAAIRDAQDRHLSRVSVVEDVTERRQAEQELRETQQYLETLVEMLPTGVVVHDQGVVRYANREALRIIGAAQPGEFVGRNLLNHFDGRAHEQVVERIKEIYRQDGAALPGEVRIRRLDDTTCEIEVAARLVELQGRRLILTVASDISQRKGQEQALRESEARLRAVIDAVPLPIVCKDRDGKLLLSNATAAEFFGQQPAELLGNTERPDWSDPTVVALLDVADRRVRETGAAEVLPELRALDRAGREIVVVHTRIPFQFSTEHADAVLGVMQDVTALKAAERELQRFNEELEGRVSARTAELAAASREMEAFSYSISHDLRAPARAMSGFAGILLEEHAGALPEDARKLVERITAAGVRMGAMIDGLLELARLSGTAVRRRPVDLALVAGEIWGEVVANEPYRTVAYSGPESCMADCDPVLIRNVLQNLLGNAFKYTRRTPVARVEFGAIGDGAERVFYVRDNGAGFDMAHAGKLFGTFQRLHGANEFEGTGVGLSTVQRIVERHGGRIWAEASPGEGASFQFTLGAERRQ